MTSRMDTSAAISPEIAAGGATTAELSAAGSPPRSTITRGQAWQAVGQAIADAAQETFSSAEYHVAFRVRSERHDGGGFERLKIVVSEVGAAKLLGAELPWSSKHPFLEISLHASDSPRYPMQVGALHFRTTNPDGQPVANLIAARVTELVAERGLQRLAPYGEARFEVVRRL